jgi:hypothetical protein
MSVKRLRKLNILLLVLLPYLAFAVGSEFLHNHGSEYAGPASSAQVRIAGQQGEASLASAKLISGRHEDCPACTWAGNSLSRLQSAVTFEQAATVSDFVISSGIPHTTGGVRLPSSRAPPLS